MNELVDVCPSHDEDVVNVAADVGYRLPGALVLQELPQREDARIEWALVKHVAIASVQHLGPLDSAL